MENDNRLAQRIQEINEYVVKEYSYDPYFDFDIVDELTIYTTNLIKMGIFDFKLVMAIGEFCALNDIANGNTPPVDVRESEGFKAFNKAINDAMQNWFAAHPNEAPVLKNLEMVPMPGFNSAGSANTDFVTRHLLKN
jgi:hypothetical protein